MNTFSFGKYRDVPLPDVPADYLYWLLKNHDDFDVKATACTEVLRRGLNPNDLPASVKRAVQPSPRPRPTDRFSRGPRFEQVGAFLRRVEREQNGGRK